MVLPREVLVHMFPPTESGLELTAALHAQRMASLSTSTAEPTVVHHLANMASAQRMQTKETKRLRKAHDKDAESSSGSGEDNCFDAADCLKQYGLPSLDHGHLLPFESLKKFVRVARKSKKKAKGKKFEFIIDNNRQGQAVQRGNDACAVGCGLVGPLSWTVNGPGSNWARECAV